VAQGPVIAPDDPRRVRSGESRQRDHLANERTLLAWVRLAVGMFAFGFVIARFGLFLSEMALATTLHSRLSTAHSLFLGLAFIASGIILAGIALSRYLAVERDIEAGLVVPRHGAAYAMFGICVAAGILLLIYLTLSWPAW